MLTLRKGGHKDLEKYYSMMEVDFDASELIGKLNIHSAMMSGAQELMILTEDESGMDLGYALVMTKGLYGYVLLKYFAVLPWYRDKGVGVEFMRLINKRYADRQGILAELTSFDDEDGSYLKKLRKFFARFGYVEVKCDYTIGGAQAELMVKPIKGPWDISTVAHRMIPDFYSRCMSAFAMEDMISISPAKKD